MQDDHNRYMHAKWPQDNTTRNTKWLQKFNSDAKQHKQSELLKNHK